MSDDYKKEFCTRCGREKKPLFNGLFCPNDCDRIPQAVQEETTAKIDVREKCPKCGSLDIGPFPLWGQATKHCIDCGAVF